MFPEETLVWQPPHNQAARPAAVEPLYGCTEKSERGLLCILADIYIYMCTKGGACVQELS